MDDWNPKVIKGEYLIDLLKALTWETLIHVRKDLGDETFVNSSLIKIVEDTIENRKRKQSLENLDTVTIDPPDFWDP